MSIWRCISKRKGMVTIPTVRMPRDRASRAMMGEAPVPVPPPMPAVINTMRVLSSKVFLISSRLASASSRPFSGFPPAPSPGPNCRRSGTGEDSNALRSVLQTRKLTSWIPSRYILATALPPPPPTPMTLMIEGSLAFFRFTISPSFGCSSVNSPRKDSLFCNFSMLLFAVSAMYRIFMNEWGSRKGPGMKPGAKCQIERRRGFSL